MYPATLQVQALHLNNQRERLCAWVAKAAEWVAEWQWLAQRIPTSDDDDGGGGGGGGGLMNHPALRLQLRMAWQHVRKVRAASFFVTRVTCVT